MAEHRGVGPLQRHQTGPVAQHLKRYFPLSSSKPPFSGLNDYHRFSDGRSKGIGEEEEADAIIVRTPLLKRKAQVEEHEIESSDYTTSEGYFAVNSPMHTPVLGKGGKIHGRGKVSKNLKFGPQTPISSDAGLLTKKFISLIKQAGDGVLDLNKAADTLEADLENLTGEEHRLDDRISEMQERLRELSGDENNKRLLYATEEDVRGLSCFQKSILIAIKAPNGTTLEVPDPDEAVDYPQRRYRMVLRSTMGPIDVYLVNGYVKFEEVNDVVEQQVLPSSCAPKAVSTVHQPQMSTKSDMEADVITEPQNLQSTYPQTNSTQDPGGIMRIVPSDIDVSYFPGANTELGGHRSIWFEEACDLYISAHDIDNLIQIQLTT